MITITRWDIIKKNQVILHKAEWFYMTGGWEI